MKLLILTPHFPPETGAPQSRLYELSKRLTGAGHQVTVLTAMPNVPVGRVFPGYRWKLWNREELDGIKVVRTWILAVKSKNTILRLVSIISWLITSLFVGFWFCRRPSILLWNSPPLFIAPVAGILKRIWRVPMVMWVADVWPESYIRFGASETSTTIRLLYWLERKSYRDADLIAPVTPGAREHIQSRFPDLQTTLWSNGVDTSLFGPEFATAEVRKKYGLAEDDFVVVFAGLHGVFQGMEVFVDAAKQLQDDPKIKLLLIGDGVRKPALLEQAKKEHLPNLIFGDPISKAEVPALIASCEASAVTLSCRMPGTMPSKFYEALASAVPAIVAGGCEAEGLIEKYQVGVSYEPMDGGSFAEAVRKLRQLAPEERSEMKNRCRELSHRFDRERLAETVKETLLALEKGEPIPEVDW
jgi:glycosyltransferase involved in cell wall biosynthesis